MTPELVKIEEQEVTPSVSMLERILTKAIEAGNMDVVERLVALKEREDAKHAEAEFNADFAKASLEMPKVTKRGVIDLGNNRQIGFARYEDLDRAIRPIEAKYGFTRMFTTSPSPTGIEMTMILAHRAGHRVTSTRFMPPDKGQLRNALQEIGSASAYAKRYLTLDGWNIVTIGQDNDAMTSACISDEQYQTITNVLDELGIKDGSDDLRRFFKFAMLPEVEVKKGKRTSVGLIQEGRYTELMIRLREKLAEKQRRGQ